MSILHGTGGFEVRESGTVVVSGRISVPADPSLEIPVYEPMQDNGDNHLIQLTRSDIYKEFRLQGYDYGPTFQGILCSDNKGRLKELSLKWEGFCLPK